MGLVMVEVKGFKVQEQVEAEKVMEGLRCCAGQGECRRCPYNADPDSDDYSGCYKMHRDAYELMKRLIMERIGS